MILNNANGVADTVGNPIANFKRQEFFMNDKEYTGGVVIEGKVASRLDNFWYHYKWHTLITLFFVIVLTVCTVQMCTNQRSDVLVMYAGSEQLDDNEQKNIVKILEHLAENDEISVGITAYNLLSEDEIRALEAETDEDGKSLFVNRSFYTEQYQVYHSYLMTGESSVMIVSEWLYRELESADRLRPVSELTDGVDEDARIGECGILLEKTDLYEKYDALKALPEDSVVCLVKPNFGMGKNSKEKNYKRDEALFVAIAEFETE